MANQVRVLGGIAVGLITATIGILQVPGWVASVKDAVVINNLAAAGLITDEDTAAVAAGARAVWADWRAALADLR